MASWISIAATASFTLLLIFQFLILEIYAKSIISSTTNNNDDGPFREWKVAFDPTYIIRFNTNSTGVAMRVTVQWDGWVGFGVARNDGWMDGADLFICGVHENGTTYYGDYYAVDHSVRRDTNSNWEFISATENGTHTEVEFSRPYDTGDIEHDVIIREGSIIVLWAYGVTDRIAYHTGSRGAVDITIREESTKNYNHQ